MARRLPFAVAMPTLERLPAEQRAILELVLRRAQSYDDLAGMLNMRASRVRELARLALEELTPNTVGLVDPEWHGQVADYVLRQQSGPEATATRGHLRRSEGARTWTHSLLDSLDEWYAEGGYPDVPAPDGRGGARGAFALFSGRRGEAPETEESSGLTAATAAPGRRAPARAPAPARDRAVRRPSPAAQAEARRRQLLGAAAGMVLVVLVVLAIIMIGIGDESEGERASAGGDPARPAEAPASQARVLAQAALEPLNEEQAGQLGGVAFAAEQRGSRQLVVQAQLRPTSRNQAYETWLYNTREDVISLGGSFPDEQGRYVGRQALPEAWRKYRFVDVSLEDVGGPPEHSGDSVVRGELGPPPEEDAAAEAPPGAAPPGGAPPEP